MRKVTGLAIAAILTVAGCSGSGSGTAPGGSGGGTPGSGQTQGAARGSITIDGNRHDFTGGTCHDDRPTAATSDFVIMFYPPNGDYMDISLKSGYVVMVAGTIGGTQFWVASRRQPHAGDQPNYLGKLPVSFFQTRCGEWNAGVPGRNMYGHRP
jgi:hypothetical protein